MKNIIAFTLMGALAVSSVSCTTTYDAYGNPRQSVDPATAVVGVAAAGVLGYAIANNRSDRKSRSKNNFRHDNRRFDNRRFDKGRGYYDRGGNYRYY